MKSIKNIFYMLGIVWKSDKGGFVWMIAYLLFSPIPTAYSALIIKLIIDAVTDRKPLSYIITIVVVYAIVELISNVFANYVYSNRFNMVKLKVQKYSNNLLLRKCSSLDMECYDDTEFYDTLSRALGQVNTRAMDIFFQVSWLFNFSMSFIVGLAIISTLDPLMIVVALISAIIISMEARNTEELEAGQYIVRYTSVLTQRFDTTAFKKALPEVYKGYLKQSASRRFTIA